MRKAFNKLHLIFGLISGIIIFIVAVTGCIYSFEEEIRNSIYSDLIYVDNNTSHQPKNLDELKGIIDHSYPGKSLKNIKIKSAPNRSIEFVLKNKTSVFIDPYTGKLLGRINKDSDFFGTVLKIHRSLLLNDLGKKITGISALIFTFMLISGIILWWPKKGSFTKKNFTIRNNTQRKRLYDLHSVLGFYASLIIIFTALTGLIWSFKWAENSMYWITGSTREKKKELHSSFIDSKSNSSIDRIIFKADSLVPGSKEKLISLPEDPTGAYKVFLRSDNDGIFRKTDQLIFDQYSLTILNKKLYSANSLGDKIKASNYDIHTGKALGLTGQLLVFFAALITASLPITGFLMWRAKTKKQA